MFISVTSFKDELIVMNMKRGIRKSALEAFFVSTFEFVGTNEYNIFGRVNQAKKGVWVVGERTSFPGNRILILLHQNLSPFANIQTSLTLRHLFFYLIQWFLLHYHSNFLSSLLPFLYGCWSPTPLTLHRN